MKVVILCGGLGTRLREETEFRPKPMVPVGERPILWHIMKIYAHYGFKEFILCLGYKGDVIKEYFRNYHWNTSDVTLRLGPRSRRSNITTSTPRKTGRSRWWTPARPRMTGGRVKRVLPYIEEDNFLLTYGDGLINSDIRKSVAFHKKAGKIVTLTAVQPASRFGDLAIDGRHRDGVQGKGRRARPSFINGGFFVVNKRIAKYLTDDKCVLEQEPLNKLAATAQIAAYEHTGFWQCMDTYREQQLLTEMWNKGDAPWKVW